MPAAAYPAILPHPRQHCTLWQTLCQSIGDREHPPSPPARDQSRVKPLHIDLTSCILCCSPSIICTCCQKEKFATPIESPLFACTRTTLMTASLAGELCVLWNEYDHCRLKCEFLSEAALPTGHNTQHISLLPDFAEETAHHSD